MISPTMVKIIAKLPKGLVKYISDKVLTYYVEKYAKMHIEGWENIKDLDKPILFIGNHLSNSDGLLLSKVFKQQEVTFVAGVKLNDNALTSLGLSIVKTINIKPNAADKEALSKIIGTLKSKNNVFIFPEGTRSRTGAMIEGKKGIVLIQKLSRCNVVPVALWGSENLLPINEKDMALEKFNVSDVYMRIGKPLVAPTKEENEDKHLYEDRVMEFYMKGIAMMLPEKYRGVYE